MGLNLCGLGTPFCYDSKLGYVEIENRAPAKWPPLYRGVDSYPKLALFHIMKKYFVGSKMCLDLTWVELGFPFCLGSKPGCLATENCAPAKWPPLFRGVDSSPKLPLWVKVRFIYDAIWLHTTKTRRRINMHGA